MLSVRKTCWKTYHSCSLGSVFVAPQRLFIPFQNMRDIYPKIKERQDQGKRTAIATVVKTWRSSPRQAGASMIVSDKREIFGLVSGGCVEGAVAISETGDRAWGKQAAIV